MDLGLDSLGLAHDSRRWLLLLGSCSEKVCPFAHMAVINVNCHRIISGTLPQTVMLTLELVVLLGIFPRLLQDCESLHR